MSVFSYFLFPQAASSHDKDHEAFSHNSDLIFTFLATDVSHLLLCFFVAPRPYDNIVSYQEYKIF